MRRAIGRIGWIVLAAAPIAGYVLVGRRWHLRWGASEIERRAAMPGDGLVAHPSIVATRAVTIDAPPAAVWPWLVQMGYRRAGWYSYDRFDNDGRVVRWIIPELQHLEVGDVMLTDSTGGFRVETIEPERALVLMIHGGPGMGDLDISAALTLCPLPDAGTRLVLRLRAEFRGRLVRLWGALLFDAGDFVMMRRMLLGIRERAEAAWQAGPVPAAPEPAALARPSPDMRAAVSGTDVGDDRFGEVLSPGPDRAAAEPTVRIVKGSMP
jgi:hypothetical protein